MWANEPEMAEKWEDEEDEKNEGKTVRVTNSQLRKLVRDQLILEQEGGGGEGGASAGETIADLIMKVPKKALIKVLAKGFKNPITSVTLGKFYMSEDSWTGLMKFLQEKLKDEMDKFTDEDAVLEYINDNADKLINFAVEYYNQENPDEDQLKLEHSNSLKWEKEEKSESRNMRVTENELRSIVRRTLLSEHVITAAIKMLMGTLDDNQRAELAASMSDPSKPTGPSGTSPPEEEVDMSMLMGPEEEELMGPEEEVDMGKYDWGELDPESQDDALDAISQDPSALADIVADNPDAIADAVGVTPGMLDKLKEAAVALGELGENTVRLTRRQLRQIIKEAVSLSKGLYAKESSYGGMFVEDSNGESISLGRMVLDLVDAGDTAFFNTDDGENPESLEKMLGRHAEGVQGGIERWDSDVFGEYYNVNNVKLVNRYASQKKLTPIHWVGEDDELPSDAAWREQNTPPEPEYEDDGTNEFEERYS